MSVEFHCHTLFSVDARGTPEDLVATAAKQGITALAVTDHNHLGAQERVRRKAAEHGIRWFSGIELNASHQGRAVDLLGFGFDPDNPRLRHIADTYFQAYAAQYPIMLELARAAGWELTHEAVLRELPRHYPTHPCPIPNSWVLRELADRRPAPGQAPFPFGELYGQMLERAAEVGKNPGFELAEVRDAVRQAGGVVVLAHVANFHPGDRNAQMRMIDAVLDDGLDGFELWHPNNLAQPHFAELEEKGRALGCLLTGGSDCHNARAERRNRLGGTRVPDWVADQIEAMLATRNK